MPCAFSPTGGCAGGTSSLRLAVAAAAGVPHRTSCGGTIGVRSHTSMERPGNEFLLQGVSSVLDTLTRFLTYRCDGG
jgi:hypothetical protein